MTLFQTRRIVLATLVLGAFRSHPVSAHLPDNSFGRKQCSPEDFGAIGNGIANDSVALKTALQTGCARLNNDKIYNLGSSDITISKSLVLEIGKGAKLINGRLQLKPVDAQKQIEIIGDLIMENGSVRVSGGADPAWADPLKADGAALTVTCRKISVTGSYPGGRAAIELWKMRDSKVGSLVVRGDGAGSDICAVQLTDVYDSEVGLIDVDGGYSMGVEFDHSSDTRAAYSLVRSKVGSVRVRKPAAFADVSGDHGVYLHGAYQSEIGLVQALGWGDGIASSADFKFRDNKDCKIGKVSVGRFRITADNNYRHFTMYNERNTIDEVRCSKGLTMVVNKGGRCKDIVLKNVTAPVTSIDSNQDYPRGIVFSGTCILGGSKGVITTSALAFEQAKITFVDAVLEGKRFFATDVEFTNSVRMTPKADSETRMHNVRVNGSLDHDAITAASMHTIDYRNVNVTGEIKVNSFGKRVIKANWKDVSSGAPEPSIARRPNNKIYSKVKFSNVFYD